MLVTPSMLVDRILLILSLEPERRSSLLPIPEFAMTISIPPVMPINSCAAFEALGWGHRVLFCQPNKCRFRTPDDLYYSVTEHNQEKFNKKLDELFIISDNKYKENIKNNIRKYCQNDINNPPHMIFQKKINELLLE